MTDKEKENLTKKVTAMLNEGVKKQVRNAIIMIANDNRMLSFGYGANYVHIQICEDVAKAFGINIYKDYSNKDIFYTDNDGETYSATVESECGEEGVIELSNGLKLRVNKEEIR